MQLRILYAVTLVSGFAGLGYEMVWTRMLTVGLGNETVSVLAVISAFFCGLAAGSWCIERLRLRPGYVAYAYAVIEGIIGLWSLLLIGLAPWSSRMVTRLLGPNPSEFAHWGSSFLFPFLLLLPATAAMGATLPVMNRWFCMIRRRGLSIAGLYAVNTFGGVAGSLVPTFLIIPRLGYGATLIFFACANFLCACGAWMLARRSVLHASNGIATDRMDCPAQAGNLAVVLFATGVLGIGYEVLVIRALSQVLENTVYSFAGVLAVYLVGTACGAAFYRRMFRERESSLGLRRLLVALSSSTLLGMLVLWNTLPLYRDIRSLWGDGYWRIVISELSLASAAYLLPTMVMGATFSHLAQQAERRGKSFGDCLALNTLGGSLAAVFFAVVLLPHSGLKWALLAVSAGYLVLVPLQGPWRYRPALIPLFGCLMIVIYPADLMLVDLGPGEKILDHREGVMAAVTIVGDNRGDVHLKVDNRFQMGGTASGFSDRRQGHIPLLLHPAPRTALYLGLGTGATFAAAADHPGLRAEGVELVPEVARYLHYFGNEASQPTRFPQLRVVIADARRFVNASRTKYDVIVADLFHPARDGAGSLYTLEHFRGIRAILSPGGVFCQWLPLYQLDINTLKVIIRTYMEVFPKGSAYLAHYSLRTPIVGLIFRDGGTDYDPAWFEKRMQDQRFKAKMKELRLDNPLDLPGCYFGSSEELHLFTNGAPVNTDDHPVVMFQAPNYVYGRPQSPAQTLMDLLIHFAPRPEQVLGAGTSQPELNMRGRLAAYWDARDEFLRAGVAVSETDDAAVLFRSAGEGLLSAVRMSPDFSAAYDPLLIMAERLSRTNPSMAVGILDRLDAANIWRPDARLLRKRLLVRRP